MDSPRRGTLLRFNTTRVGYVINLRRDNGQIVERLVLDEVASALAAQYGVRSKTNATTSSMKALSGSAIEYRETQMGLITEVKILAN
jgi:hypothetical protein